MSTIKQRIAYNNDWPENFLFETEKQFMSLLEFNNTQQAISQAQLSLSDDTKFHFQLAYLLDALDMLPTRPDLAFDHIWKALDDEFFLVQQESGQGQSRFDIFIDQILDDPKTSSAFLKYLAIIPYQTCEYAAKRIITADHLASSDNFQGRILKGASQSLGEEFVTAFVQKYVVAQNGKPNAKDTRNSGRLLKKLFLGKTITLSNGSFNISQRDTVAFLLKTVLANFRNERFHGKVFPPYRSSKASLDTYAHSYYLLHISYALLLDVWLYREYDVCTVEQVQSVTVRNIELFQTIFKKCL